MVENELLKYILSWSWKILFVLIGWKFWKDRKKKPSIAINKANAQHVTKEDNNAK